MDFNEGHLHEMTLNLHTQTWIFSCWPIASVDGKLHLNEVVFSDFHCKENDGTTGTAHLIQTFLAISPDIRRGGSLSNHRILVFCQKSLNQVCCSSCSLQWKSDKSTKHYLTQMLLAFNWRYWQAGKKNSHMCMMVQGRLMQACLIEIHQVFAKKGRMLF